MICVATKATRPGRVRSLVVGAVAALASLLPSVASAAVCANLSSVDIGFGSSVLISGQSTGPSLGGLLYWEQVQPNAPSLWNGRDGFSDSRFVSIALNATWDRDLESDQTYHFQALPNVSSTGAMGSPTVSPLAAAYIGQLWERHMSETVKARNVGFAGPRRTMIGAMQTAVWKLVYDQGLNFDLGSGNVRVSGSSPASALAQQWLDELALSGPEGLQANLVAMVGDQGQVHIAEATVLAQTLVEQSVPEPASFVVWGFLGVAALVVSRRCRQVPPRARISPRAASFSSDLPQEPGLVR